MKQLARADGKSAAMWLDGKVEDGFETSPWAFFTTAEEWIAYDSCAAIAWLESHYDRIDDQTVRYVLSEWDPQDMGRSLKWIEKQMASGNRFINPSVVSSISRNLAENLDPKVAINWAANLPESNHDWCFMSIAYGWPEGSLQQADAWLATHPSNDTYDMARGALAERLKKTNPREAARVAETITEDSYRQHQLIRVAKTYLEADPDAAVEWLSANGLAELPGLKIPARN